MTPVSTRARCWLDDAGGDHNITCWPRPARRRDRGAGVLRGAAPLRNRRPGLGRHPRRRRTPASLRIRNRSSKTNADGRREDLRLLAGPFARAVEDLRATTSPDVADRVVPLGPHQVNRRLQVLAAMLGLEGVSSHSGRRGLASELVRRGASTTAVQTAGGWRSAAMVARYASAIEKARLSDAFDRFLRRRR